MNTTTWWGGATTPAAGTRHRGESSSETLAAVVVPAGVNRVGFRGLASGTVGAVPAARCYPGCIRPHIRVFICAVDLRGLPPPRHRRWLASSSPLPLRQRSSRRPLAAAPSSVTLAAADTTLCIARMVGCCRGRPHAARYGAPLLLPRRPLYTNGIVTSAALPVINATTTAPVARGARRWRRVLVTAGVGCSAGRGRSRTAPLPPSCGCPTWMTWHGAGVAGVAGVGRGGGGWATTKGTVYLGKKTNSIHNPSHPKERSTCSLWPACG